jgi:DNA mismatch repair ATPase MutS
MFTQTSLSSPLLRLISFFIRRSEAPIQEGAYYDDQVTVPLYKLRLGVNRQSGGIHCANSCGIPSSIISRANEISSTLSHHSMIEPMKRYQISQMNKILEKKELLKLFFSIENWEESTDEDLVKMRTLLKVGEKK